jgi:hypothetical protein
VTDLHGSLSSRLERTLNDDPVAEVELADERGRDERIVVSLREVRAKSPDESKLFVPDQFEDAVKSLIGHRSSLVMMTIVQDSKRGFSNTDVAVVDFEEWDARSSGHRAIPHVRAS